MNNDEKSEINQFLDQIVDALATSEKGADMPKIETSRKIIQHYNRGLAIKGFDSVGYFVFNGVKVYEHGKATDKDGLTTEEQNFGVK